MTTTLPNFLSTYLNLAWSLTNSGQAPSVIIGLWLLLCPVLVVGIGIHLFWSAVRWDNQAVIRQNRRAANRAADSRRDNR